MADVNAVDLALQETPLMLVAHSGNLGLLRMLLEAKADISLRNAQGLTAMDLAEEGSFRQAFVAELFSRGLLANNVPPTRAVASRAPPTVSVICPTTTERAAFHRNIYMCFVTQSLPEKELIIIDTGSSPSPFFSAPPASRDSRVVYRFFKDEPNEHKANTLGSKTIGGKRNLAISLARGSLIAHFDDDDLYAPGYLEQMAEVAARQNAHAVKLSAWFTFHVPSGLVGFCDPELSDNSALREQEMLGYGFSYVYQRQVALKHPFPEVSFGEDYEFMVSVQQAGYSVSFWPDIDCCCLHLQHGRNTSNNAACDQVPREVLNSAQLARCPLLSQLLKMNPQRSETCSLVPSRGESSRSPLLSLALAAMHISPTSPRRSRGVHKVQNGMELIWDVATLDSKAASQLLKRPSFLQFTRHFQGAS
jgi:hypothetical protein